MRNSLALMLAILAILAAACSSIPTNRHRREIDDDDDDDDFVEPIPILDNNESMMDEPVVLQSPDEKGKAEAPATTEKPNAKSKQPPETASSKCDSTAEKKSIDNPPTEKPPAKTSPTVKPLANKTSTEEPTTEKTSTGKPKAEVTKIPDESKSSNETLPVVPLIGSSSDEELTGLFAESEPPGLFQRLRKRWQDYRNMMAVVEIWNRIRDFIENLTGLKLS